MINNTSNSNKMNYIFKVLKCLRNDPTRSPREIAKEIKSYRQKVWRTKKELEKKKAIWGYTAVIDETKFKHGLYQLMLKCKPLNKKFAEVIIKEIGTGQPEENDVIIKDVLYVSGEYDFIIYFSAPDHSTARKIYNEVRIKYQKYLIEKPVMVNVDFPLVREGKINPDLEKLHEMVPA